MKMLLSGYNVKNFVLKINVFRQNTFSLSVILGLNVTLTCFCEIHSYSDSTKIQQIMMHQLHRMSPFHSEVTVGFFFNLSVGTGHTVAMCVNIEQLKSVLWCI